MIHINLRPRAQIVYPHSGKEIGRFVITGREIVRRRLLGQSLRSIRDFLEKNIPDLCKVRQAGPLKKMEERQARDQMRELPDTGRINGSRDLPWEGISGKLDFLNRLCRDKKIGGRHLEFVLGDLSGLPASLVRIISRPKPLDTDAENRLLGGGALAGYLALLMKLTGKIYTRSELSRMISAEIGEVGRNAAASFLGPGSKHIFKQLLRPRRLAEAEPLYFVAGTGLKTCSQKIAPVILAGGRSFSVILRAEADEMEKEGKIIPVFSGKKLPFYFIPEALKEWIEQGRVMEVEKEGKKQFIETASIGKYIKAVSAIRLAGPSAAAVFQNYLRAGKLNDQERRSYPLLAATIQSLEASPRGAAPYIDAAGIAARRSASETDMAVILLQKTRDESPEREGRDFQLAFDNRLMKSYLEAGCDLLHYYKLINELKDRLRSFEKLQAMDISDVPIRDAADVRSYLRSFMSRFARQETRLEYLATVLGQLRHTAVGGLNRNEVRNLLVVVTPLAEKCGLADLAADIRNEIFRISNHRQYDRVKKSIEKIMGMTYPEMVLHLENTAELLREVLAADGVGPADYEIFYRVKHPYSAWEKMRTYGMEQPGYVFDILGITGLLRDRRAVYRMLDLTQQVLPELSRRNFDDRHGLLKYMKKAGLPIFIDRFAHPKPSGFAAVTDRRLTLLRLPIEVQLTTFDHHRVNKDGRAAHWQYKMQREIKTFFGLEVGDLSAL